MIKKIEHIAIAVDDAKESIDIFNKLLGFASYKSEKVTSEGVNTYFYQLGKTKIELLEAIDNKSPIKKFISKNGPGLHHIALKVDDIKFELKRLVDLGFEKIGNKKKGADEQLICFLHPKSTNGVLIELCQDLDKN